MGATLGSLTEIRELKSEIIGLRTELKRFIEHANQQHVDGVLYWPEERLRRRVYKRPG